MLPWRDHDPERLAKVNGAIRETCCEMCVKYVDHDGNFTFRDGTVDEAAYVSMSAMVCTYRGGGGGCGQNAGEFRSA